MFKELRFDVVGAVNRTEKYDGEWEAIHQFNASEHKNMVFDYDSEREAESAYAFLAKLIKKENIPLKLQSFRKTSLLVTRIDGGEKNV